MKYYLLCSYLRCMSLTFLMSLQTQIISEYRSYNEVTCKQLKRKIKTFLILNPSIPVRDCVSSSYDQHYLYFTKYLQVGAAWKCCCGMISSSTTKSVFSLCQCRSIVYKQYDINTRYRISAKLSARTVASLMLVQGKFCVAQKRTVTEKPPAL